MGLLLIAFAGQYGGILRVARIQAVVGIVVVLPILVIGIVPFLAGEVELANLLPLVPVKYGPSGEILAGGAWNNAGWTLFLGGMFAAAWSTYSFETAVCYTREFRDPARDTAKAILYSGALCLCTFLTLPIAFQGSLGVARMLEPGIYDGSGVAAALAGTVGGGPLVEGLLVVLMVFGLLLTIMTAMAGTCRTQYQASVDGWFPRYLARVNSHGVPTRAMATDLVVNIVLLMFSDYLFVLAVSCCNYIVFNFLNLNAGWLHRVDNAHVARPWRAPTALLAVGTVFAYANAGFLGAGAEIWGPNTLMIGIAVMALVIPVFGFRHYVRDGGRFPPGMLRDLGIPDGSLGERKAGPWPYLALLGGLIIVAGAAAVFSLS
ncbi:MAG: APC family permease, partial [Pseudomonadota bacterium]